MNALTHTRRTKPTRPRVALVAHTIVNKGGMERTAWELVNNGSARYSFIAVTSDLAPELRPLVDQWLPIAIPAFPAPLRFLTFLVKAGIALTKVDAEIVHTVGAIVPNRANVITVQFCHAGYRRALLGWEQFGDSALRRLNSATAYVLARAAERWCYRPTRVDMIAAVSKGLANEVRCHYRAIPVEITPNGVEHQRFARAFGSEITRSREAIGEQIVLLFVGGDWTRKGLKLAIEALAIARRSQIPFVLWVLGSGPQKTFKDVAEEAGVKEFLLFLGDRHNTEEFYRAADIFLLPSAYETFSLASFEAAAAGLPLVIPRIHGASELVGRNEAGIIIERNPENIAEAIVRLARDPQLRRNLGEEARRRAAEYTWQRSAQSTFNLYESILLHRKQPAPFERPESSQSQRKTLPSTSVSSDKNNIQRRLRSFRSRVMPDQMFYLPALTGPIQGTRVPVNFRHGIRAWLGVYEIEVSRHLRNLVVPQGVSFDIGASFGYYSLSLARAGSRRVFAFDPDTDAFALMRETIARNPALGRMIQPHNFAVGKEPESISVDKFVEQDTVGRSPQFIKVDVEGAELEVLEGATQTLSRSRPRLIIEVHSIELKTSCLQVLSELGYRHRIIRPQTFWPELRPLELNQWLIAAHKSDACTAV